MGESLSWSWLVGDAGLGPGREPWKSQVFWLIKESKIFREDLTFIRIFCQIEIVSETWALPITVLFAMVAYAVVAGIFYNIYG